MKAKSMKKLLLMVFLIFCSLIFVFPFYTMIMMSTYYSEDIYKGIPLLPGGYLLENLKTVFSAHFEVFYINSLITAVSAAFLSVTVSCLCGYSFAKFEYKGRKLLFNFVMITMMIPAQLGLVAFVVEMKDRLDQHPTSPNHSARRNRFWRLLDEKLYERHPPF